MDDEIVTEDSCDGCSETIYYGDDGIVCDWWDLAVEHECDPEWIDD